MGDLLLIHSIFYSNPIVPQTASIDGGLLCGVIHMQDAEAGIVTDFPNFANQQRPNNSLFQIGPFRDTFIEFADTILQVSTA